MSIRTNPDNATQIVRKPHQAELERIVGHFLYYMSQEDRRRLYGELPIESKLLYPDLDDDIILAHVRRRLQEVVTQSDLIPRHGVNWRSH